MYAVLEGQEWLVVAGVGLVFVAGAWLPDFARSLTRARGEYRRARREDGPPAGVAPPGSSPVVGSAEIGSPAVVVEDGSTVEGRAPLDPPPAAPPILEPPSPIVLTGGAFGGEQDAGTIVVPHRPAVPVVSRAAIGAVPLVLPSDAAEPPGVQAGWEEGEWDGVTAGWTDDADPRRAPGRSGTVEPAGARDRGDDDGPAPVVEDPHAAMWRRVDRITSERVAAPRSLPRPRRRPAGPSRRDPAQP
ncbi:MAG: twin-arginine translocase TatA/TatE family subunit [Acidimicrobiales bacterium]|nr:twin-arginine translocase TatA/TatE family subunit [Acidimicrobiales bacterium]